MFDKSKFSFIVFTVTVLIIVIGGYFLMNYALDYDYSKDEEKDYVVELIDYRLDKTKDYVYVENVEYPIKGSQISRQDIVINLSGYEYLSNILNEEENEFLDLTIYEEDVNLENYNDLFSNNEEIYSITYREYNILEYDSYISIIIEDFEYNIVNQVNLENISVYIIDKNTNELIEEEEILLLYEKDIIEIMDNLEDVLETKSYSDNNILVDSTMDSLNYVVYPNKVGSLEIMYKVISTNNNYYDKLVIN